MFVLIQDDLEFMKILIQKTLKGTFFDYSNAFKTKSLFLIVEKNFNKETLIQTIQSVFKIFVLIFKTLNFLKNIKFKINLKKWYVIQIYLKLEFYSI